MDSGSWYDEWLNEGMELFIGCILLVVSGWWWFDSRGAIWDGWRNVLASLTVVLGPLFVIRAWIRRAERDPGLRDWSAVWLWEHDHLPEDVQQRISEPTHIVLGLGPYGLDSLSIELAADEIGAALGEHPTAREAFRSWFVSRYPTSGD